jgi:hypothetical protein
VDVTGPKDGVSPILESDVAWVFLCFLRIPYF